MYVHRLKSHNIDRKSVGPSVLEPGLHISVSQSCHEVVSTALCHDSACRNAGVVKHKPFHSLTVWRVSTGGE